MPLRIRRGTNAERLTIIPLEGELVYTTDTKRIFIGDGTTSGGVDVSATPGGPIGSDLILNGYNLTGTGDIDINGSVTATAFNGDFNGSVFADDSSLLVDSVAGKIVGDVETSRLRTTETKIALGLAAGEINQGTNAIAIGQNAAQLNQGNDAIAIGRSAVASNQTAGSIVLNATGTSVTAAAAGFYVEPIRNQPGTGNILQYNTSTKEITYSSGLSGNFSGSFYSDDSTLVIDGLNGHIFASSIISTSGTLRVTSTINGNNQLKLVTENGRSILKFTRVSAGSLIGSNARYGGIFFEREDINGPLTTSAIVAGENYMFFTATANGNIADPVSTLSLNNKKLGIGTLTPAETLDVRGNGIFEGNVVAAAFKGSLFGDDSSVIVDAINSTITVGGFVQFGSYTKAERDNLSAGNGMVLYNTTSNRFQGFQNSAWINLDDGSFDP